jgi:hypothetical protein
MADDNTPDRTGPPDQVETDPTALNSAEDLDEDRLRLDPLEEGMDPPEHWSAAMGHGTTANEQREGQELGDRLAEEEPDVPVVETEPRDEIDRMDARGELEAGRPDDGLPFGRTDLPETRQGPSTEEAGESVARELRTPAEPPD